MENETIAFVCNASEKNAKKVLDGDKSNFKWITLSNGDVLLGVFPQGDTYEEIKPEACGH